MRFAPGGGRLEWAGLLVVATASVVFFGAVEERFLAPIEFTLFCLAGIALVRRSRRGLPILNLHPAATPLIAILGLCIVQLIPLPTSLTYVLSPGMAALREGIPGSPASTVPLSVYPYATQLAILRIAAYGVFFLMALEAMSSPGRLRTALAWAAGLGTAVALYGLFNYLTGNTRLLWLPRRFYLGCATGTFVNRNHFAALMVLLMPAVLACYWTRPGAAWPTRDRGDATARAAFFVLCGAVMGLALLFSKSRAGIVCGILSLAGLTFVLRRHGGRPGRALAVLPIVFGGIVVSWGLYIGIDGIVERFAGIASGGASGEGRGAQWVDTLRATRDFPLLGSGLGTYEFLYPAYKTLRVQADFAHAHNDYIEVLAEGGVVGLGLLGWGIVRFARRNMNVRSGRGEPATLVVWTLTTGVVGMLLHSLVDFGLHIPGNAFCLLLVAAMAIRVAEDPELAEFVPHPRRSRHGSVPSRTAGDHG